MAFFPYCLALGAQILSSLPLVLLAVCTLTFDTSGKVVLHHDHWRESRGICQLGSTTLYTSGFIAFQEVCCFPELGTKGRARFWDAVTNEPSGVKLYPRPRQARVGGRWEWPRQSPKNNSHACSE